MNMNTTGRPRPKSGEMAPNTEDISNQPNPQEASVPTDGQANKDAILSPVERSDIKAALGNIRAALGRLPSNNVAEITSLLATAEGHLAATPPNVIATEEAFGLIRDLVDEAANSEVAHSLSTMITSLLQMLK
jgi:hypothetical protein